MDGISLPFQAAGSMSIVPVLLASVPQDPQQQQQQPFFCSLPILADAALAELLFHSPTVAFLQLHPSTQLALEAAQTLSEAGGDLSASLREEQQEQRNLVENNSAASITAKDERARNGQVNWHAICEQIITSWFETFVKVQDSGFKEKLDSQMKYCCKMRLKCTKRSVLAFLHLCAVNELIFLEHQDNPEEGFCGISGFNVSPNRSTEFYNRFVTLRRGRFQSFDASDAPAYHEKLRISHVEEHSVRNIFRNVCLVPKDPARWTEAFDGMTPFVFTKTKKQSVPRASRARPPRPSGNGGAPSGSATPPG
eukprot:768595-Hanusia_phi.AAC.3